MCAATGRAAEALTLWAACAAADRHHGPTYPPCFEFLREEQVREARQVLGSGPARRPRTAARQWGRRSYFSMFFFPRVLGQ